MRTAIVSVHFLLRLLVMTLLASTQGHSIEHCSLHECGNLKSINERFSFLIYTHSTSTSEIDSPLHIDYVQERGGNGQFDYILCLREQILTREDNKAKFGQITTNRLRIRVFSPGKTLFKDEKGYSV